MKIEPTVERQKREGVYSDIDLGKNGAYGKE